MQDFTQTIQVRWADIDANRHLRHSVYYDYGATARMNMLSEAGLSIKKLEELQVGPILFREEAIFRREIVFEDKIAVTVELVRATSDFGRWSLRHRFIKGDDLVAAILTVDGAWIDLVRRKLAVPDAFVKDVFERFPKADDFEWITPSKQML